MIIWAIPGAGKSSLAEAYPHLSIIDWDSWQRSYRTKHPKLQKKVGYGKFLELCLESCVKHNPSSIILTSKILHIKIADIVVVHYNLDKFLSSTNRPGREEWSEKKCIKRLRQYKELINIHNKSHHLMLDNEFFLHTVQRLELFSLD